MWLDMAGVKTVPLAANAGLIPSADDAATLITSKTRAIVLVTPNNPGGVEYPAETVKAFAVLARARGIALIIDETYRDFDSRTGAPHDLFQDPDWGDTLIQLYSFSKAYRLTGHRVGALVASPSRLVEVEKFLDNGHDLSQPAWATRGALGHAETWRLAGRVSVLKFLIGARAIEEQFTRLETLGWELEGCGAYFAYIKHPFNMRSDYLARDLVKKAGRPHPARHDVHCQTAKARNTYGSLSQTWIAQR